MWCFPCVFVRKGEECAKPCWSTQILERLRIGWDYTMCWWTARRTFLCHHQLKWHLSHATNLFLTFLNSPRCCSSQRGKVLKSSDYSFLYSFQGKSQVQTACKKHFFISSFFKYSSHAATNTMIPSAQSSLQIKSILRRRHPPELF